MVPISSTVCLDRWDHATECGDREIINKKAHNEEMYT